MEMTHIALPDEQYDKFYHDLKNGKGMINFTHNHLRIKIALIKGDIMVGHVNGKQVSIVKETTAKWMAGANRDNYIKHNVMELRESKKSSRLSR